LLIDTPRAWQSGFAITPLRPQHADDAIAKAQEWIHQHFARNFPVDEPAEHVGMSTRNFARRFKQATGDSPLMYLQKVRVAGAKRLLENESRTLQEVSDAVGYSDAAFFRTIFQRHTGESPAGYRRRFS
jgi:transcriptional regulator GlxA family with amidase domain